jgi:predicted small lipoprotein YifL
LPFKQFITRIIIMTCWARYLLLLVVLILGSASMLSACGKKGPLYHPDDKPASKESKT